MNRKIFLAVTLFILLSFSIIFAQVVPTTEQITAWNEFNSKYDGKFRIVWHKKTGTPKVITDFKTRPTNLIKDGAETVAKNFFKDNEKLFNIRRDKDSFVLKKEWKRDFMRHLQFKQKYKGVKVYTGGYKVSMDNEGRIHMINGRSYPEIDIDIKPGISRETAITAAHNFLNVGDNYSRAKCELCVYPENSKYILAYEVELYYPGIMQHWLIFVNVNNGIIIKKENQICGITGSGRIYQIDPGHSDTTTVDLEYLDGTGYLRNSFIDSIWNEKNEDYAYNANNIFKYNPPSNPDSTADFTHFNDVNVYYHVTKYIYDYIIDDIDANFSLAKKLYIITSSKYSPGFNPTDTYYQIRLFWGFNGSGTSPDDWNNDTNKKDEVIYHELQHAITYDAGIGYSGETGALNEAYSDYFAGSFTESDTVGEWVTRVNYPYDPPHLRMLNTDPDTFNYDNFNNVSYGEKTPVGSKYANSMIFSGMLWDLRSTSGLGQPLIDHLTYLSFSYMDENADFDDAFYALRHADLNHYGGWHIETIEDVCAERGIPSDGGGKFGIPPVSNELTIPEEFSLSQNYPNPFNAETTIKFSLPVESKVYLIIYNVLGQEVLRLKNGGKMESGVHSIKWKTLNISSGIYLCKIRAGKFEKVRKMALLK